MKEDTAIKASRTGGGRPAARRGSSDELRNIPGVGPRMAEDLQSVGIRKVSQLRGRSPQCLYEKLCAAQGARLDRCVLYVLRCAVYYASTPHPRADRLKWWNWKDG